MGVEYKFNSIHSKLVFVNWKVSIKRKVRALRRVSLKFRKMSTVVTNVWCLVIELLPWEKLLSYKKVFWSLKQSFLLNSINLNQSFSTYPDVIETSKPTGIITNIDTKLSVFAGKVEAQNEQKLKKRKQ